jgi:hypothetical protein
MDQLKNMTQRTCIYLIANELQILALNHSHFAIGCVPSRALQNMTCPSVNSESRIEAGIAVGQSKASHLVDLVGKVRFTAHGYFQVCMMIVSPINFLLERVNIFENGNISEMWFELNLPSSGWCPSSSHKFTTKATA